MKKTNNRFLIVLAAIFAAFCVISFAVPFVKNGVFWMAFVFGVIAIAVQLYAFPKAFSGESAKSKFYGFPIARLTVGYLAVQLALSIVFMAIAKVAPLWVELVACTVILLVTLVGFVSAESMRDEIESQDKKLKTNVSAMRAMQSRVKNLAISCPADVKSALDKLADEFRYSDPVSSDAVEDVERELSAGIDELQKAVVDADNAAIAELCRKLTLTLAERNRLCMLNK